jgi:hypothetical protein
MVVAASLAQPARSRLPQLCRVPAATRLDAQSNPVLPSLPSKLSRVSIDDIIDSFLYSIKQTLAQRLRAGGAEDWSERALTQIR